MFEIVILLKLSVSDLANLIERTSLCECGVVYPVNWRCNL